MGEELSKERGEEWNEEWGEIWSEDLVVSEGSLHNQNLKAEFIWRASQCCALLHYPWFACGHCI